MGLASCLVIAFVGVVVYRNQGRLTWEKLEEARSRWNAAGIDDYDITVNVTGGTQGTYRLEVRKGEITKASRNGLPFENINQALPWTVPELFNILQMDLENDARTGTVPYTRVEFDARDGHLVTYARSTSRQNIAIHVDLRAERDPP